MSTRRLRGILASAVITALLASIALIAPASAVACEDAQIRIAAVARGYDVPDEGRYLDGIVTNDTTQTLVADHVDIGWAQNGRLVTQAWLCSEFLAPGEWTTFHIEWPHYIPAGWTPQPVGLAYADDGPGKLPLTVNEISDPTIDDCGNRVYDVNVTNPNPFPVSSIDAIGAEKDGDDAFVDALDDGCSVPDSIAANDSADFTMTGEAPTDTALVPDVRVLGLEQPTLTMTADTLAPAAGTPVTFTLTMTHSDGTPVTGCREIKLLYAKDADDLDCRGFELHLGRSNTTTAAVYTWKPTYFKAVYWGGDDLGWTESDVLFVQPSASTAVTPPSFPGRVHRRHVFVVRGRMGADPDSSGARITLVAEKHLGGRHWKRVASVNTAPNAAGQFSAKLKISATGTYRIRSYRSGVGYTKYRTLKVVK